MVEHLLCTQGVVGSIPIASIRLKAAPILDPSWPAENGPCEGLTRIVRTLFLMMMESHLVQGAVSGVNENLLLDGGGRVIMVGLRGGRLAEKRQGGVWVSCPPALIVTRASTRGQGSRDHAKTQRRKDGVG